MDSMVHCNKKNSFPNIATNYQNSRPLPQSILQFPTLRKSTPVSSSGNVTSTVTKQQSSISTISQKLPPTASSWSPGSKFIITIWLQCGLCCTINYANHILIFALFYTLFGYSAIIKKVRVREKNVNKEDLKVFRSTMPGVKKLREITLSTPANKSQNSG